MSRWALLYLQPLDKVLHKLHFLARSGFGEEQVTISHIVCFVTGLTNHVNYFNLQVRDSNLTAQYSLFVTYISPR